MIRLYMFLLAMCLVCLLAIILVYLTTGGNYPFDYGIVIDAGSSHSEVSLFKWLGDEVNDTGVVVELSDCGTHEGIDDNEGDIQPTIESLQKCINTVAQFIDIDLNGETPLYLGATAGMRLLKLKNEQMAITIIDSINKAFSQYETGGKIIDAKDVRIIPGSEEALFGWVSVNYLLDITTPFKQGKSKQKSVGFMEMGGASAQISYEVNQKEGEDVKSVTLYGQEYYVKTKSNICFGADEARKRYLVTLIHEDPSKKVITDPCLQKEAQKAIHGSELFDSICLKKVSDITDLYDRNASYLFVGSGDVNKCRSEIEKIVDITECKKTFKRCFDAEDNPAPSDMDFYAISNYYFATSNSFPLLKNLTENTYLSNTERWCKRKWSEVVGHVRYPLSYVVDYCFTLNYIYETFRKVYKFESSSFPRIHFKNKIKAQNIGWNLGFMINATNQLPALRPYPPLIPKPSFIFLTTFIGIISITSIALLIYGKRQKQRLNVQII